VGLDAALLGRRVPHLSGGEQQRVAIARTLAAEPRVILYDEPLGSLDPTRREGLRALIRDIATREGRATLYVTHDAEEALELGDEIAVVAEGRLIARATPDALYRAPPSLLAARALGPVSALPVHAEGGQLQSALGVVDVGSSGSHGAGPYIALLRPEHVVVSPTGVSAHVESARPAGERWRFRARVGERVLLGESPTALEIGSHVTIAVRGTPAVVPLTNSVHAPAPAAVAGGTD
jgi:ABC-type sulfate/molybdate transport systems ATPase subunit